MSAKEMASKWKISEWRIQKLCEENRMKGVQRFGRSWMIPKTLEKSKDLRRKRGDMGV